MQFRDGRQGRAGRSPCPRCRATPTRQRWRRPSCSTPTAEPGGQALRDFAAALRHRFRERFWVEDEAGPFPAMALDGHGIPLDVPGSNMGHLLGTGLLDPAEARLVADRLVSPELFSGYGDSHDLPARCRVLALQLPLRLGLEPRHRHCDPRPPGRGFHRRRPAVLADGLLAAAASFGHRLPEVFAGVRAEDSGSGGARIRRRATRRRWSSASAVVIAQAMGVGL